MTFYRGPTVLDHVFVSEGLLNSISNVSIGDYHDNNSDHLPVEIDLTISLLLITKTRNQVISLMQLLVKVEA